MKVVAIQSNYIPWKGYFDIIHDADVFVFYDEVKYTKNDWRNRNRIYTKNGLTWLTIPIPSSSVKLKISEVMISDKLWRARHQKTLEQSYASAPHFSQLREIVDKCLGEQGSDRLIDINRGFVLELASRLNIRTKFVDSKDFSLVDGRIERLLFLLKELGATEYIAGPTSRNYIEPHRIQFLEEWIQITYKDYSNYPAYSQLSEPFENAVSILDLVANIGFSEIPWYIWGWLTEKMAQVA